MKRVGHISWEEGREVEHVGVCCCIVCVRLLGEIRLFLLK